MHQSATTPLLLVWLHSAAASPCLRCVCACCCLQVRMDGTSPLWLAANAPDDGGEAAALELLEAGAKADIVGSRGGTALHGAAFHGRSKLASALIAAGCPVNAVNSKTSYTALHTAAETKHPKVCEARSVGTVLASIGLSCVVAAATSCRVSAPLLGALPLSA